MVDKYFDAYCDIIDNGVTMEYFNEKAKLPQSENPIMIVQEAIDKQSPMRIKKYVEDEYFLCPNCYTHVWGNTNVNFCSECGHAVTTHVK